MLLVVMEKMSGGELFDRISKKKRFTEREACCVTKQVCVFVCVFVCGLFNTLLLVSLCLSVCWSVCMTVSLCTDVYLFGCFISFQNKEITLKMSILCCQLKNDE